MQAVIIAVFALVAFANANTLTCSFANSVAYSTANCTELTAICTYGTVSYYGTGTFHYNGTATCQANSTTASCAIAVGTCPSSTVLATVCNYIVTNNEGSVVFTYTNVNASCSNGSSSTCFPASASVQLQDGTTKTMAQLEVGDKVLVAPSTYSEVYFFAHRLTDALVAFVKIATSNGNTLMLTGDHYLYVNGKLATAKTVKVGDSLIAADGSSIRVVEVSSEISTGLYNPHTMQGDIVVDGVKTSTYTSSIAPSLAHAMLWPVRMLYSLGQNIVDGAFNEGSELISALFPNGKDTY